MHVYLYPFLNSINKSKEFEYIRLTALGVIGALVKSEKNISSYIVDNLLSTEIIPLCLRIMDKGTDLSKTVATFIIQRILLDENGLSYICNTAERFLAVYLYYNNYKGNISSFENDWDIYVFKVIEAYYKVICNSC